MREIELTQGKVTQVDDDDYVDLSYYEWYAMYKSGTWYAAMDIGRGIHIYIHELLCEKREGYFIDHKDHDGLNNQRSNLRECTQSQNNANARKRTGTTSSYKGVSFDSERQRWLAQLSVDKRKVLFKRFHTEVEAALAYNDVAVVVFGEFANLNAINV